MAGKHRAEGSSSSNTIAKVGALAGLAVTASLISAGTADAKPANPFGNFGSSANSAANSISTALQPKNIFGAGGGFFTTPKTTTVPFGGLITKTNPAPTNGIGYITAPGTFQITGFCVNPNGC